MDKTEKPTLRVPEHYKEDPEIMEKIERLKIGKADQPKSIIALKISRDEVKVLMGVILELGESGLLSIIAQTEYSQKVFIDFVDQLNEIVHEEEWCIDPKCKYWRHRN